MGAKTASVTVVGAAIVGGGIRLLFYPQFILGAVLVLVSILIKLSRNLLGVAILVLSLLTLIVLGFIFNRQILRGLKRSVPVVGRFAKSLSSSAKDSAARIVSNTPPYVVTSVAFLLPALGQFAGSMATVKMLSNLDVKPSALPGTGYIAVSSVLYLLSMTIGISDDWLKPSKISFLLQSFWVGAAFFSPAGKDLELREHLPSVLAGWGSFFLQMTPGAAFVGAAKAAAASAAIAGASVATVEGVKALRQKSGSEGQHRLSQRSNELDYRSEDREEESGSEAQEEKEADHDGLKELKQTWVAWFDENRLQTWLQHTFSRESILSFFSSSKDSFDHAISRSKSNVEGILSDPRSALLQADEDQDHDESEENDAKIQQLATEEEKSEIVENAEQAGFDVNSLAPPLQIALPILLLRALPTFMTLVIGISMTIVSIFRGSFKPGMLAIPFALAPFALGEIVSLVRRIGFKNVLTGRIFRSKYHERLREEYSDGMALLLWQSPSMLRFWRSISSISSANFMDDLKNAPSQFLNPDEATIQATPDFTLWVVLKLGFSVVIDIIGMSSFALPGVGELGDLVWAPLQGYLIHHMYSLPWISWLGVVEELLPFTDFIPTAILGWIYTYGPYFPVWIRRLSRRRKVSKSE